MMCLLHTGKDRIHEDILKAILRIYQRRLKRLFILVLGVTLSTILISLYISYPFQSHGTRHGGRFGVAMTADNPYHHVFECKPEITEIIDVESEEAGKALSQRIKQTDFLRRT